MLLYYNMSVAVHILLQLWAGMSVYTWVLQSLLKNCITADILVALSFGAFTKLFHFLGYFLIENTANSNLVYTESSSFELYYSLNCLQIYITLKLWSFYHPLYVTEPLQLQRSICCSNTIVHEDYSSWMLWTWIN